MSNIELDQARTIIREALRGAREAGFKPLTVAVLDLGGRVKAIEREDGSGILRPDMAIAKAWGALGLGLPSRTIAAMAQERPGFFSAVASLAGGRLLPAPGGVLIRDSDGELMGAVGITGDTSDNDEICALRGVEAAGLTPDAGESS